MVQDSSFRIAFCILCHKYTPVLTELIHQLDVPGNELFIHVDGKTNINTFEILRRHERIHIIEPRVKIYWGEFSMVESTLQLFTATQNKDFHYIILISGDTLPLQTAEEIHTALRSAYTEKQEFIPIDPTITDAIINRVRWRYFYPNKVTIMRRIKRLAMKCCFHKKNPYFNKLPTLKKGSQWLAITNYFRDYIFDYLAAHPDFIPAFRYSHAADEMFFQTLICDTSFADRNTCSSLVYTDWENTDSHPKTFTTNDLEHLAALKSISKEYPYSPLFARKFNDGLDIARYREILFGQETKAAR